MPCAGPPCRRRQPFRAPLTGSVHPSSPKIDHPQTPRDGGFRTIAPGEARFCQRISYSLTLASHSEDHKQNGCRMHDESILDTGRSRGKFRKHCSCARSSRPRFRRIFQRRSRWIIAIAKMAGIILVEAAILVPSHGRYQRDLPGKPRQSGRARVTSGLKNRAMNCLLTLGLILPTQKNI